MNSSDDGANASPTSSHTTTWVVLSIVVLQILIALVAYPFLPAQIPSHWNIAGEVDEYLPKAIGLAIFPVVSIFIYFLVRFLIGLGPRLGKQNQRANIQIISIVLVGEVLLMLVLELVTIAAALRVAVNMNFILSITLSALFIFMGNYFGKFRRNFWAGIRTPWTLASDPVWERTHRIGGWLFVAMGLLGLLMSFIPFLQLWGLLGLLLLVTLFLFVYSYVIFHRLESRGVDPLSSPFDEPR